MKNVNEIAEMVVNKVDMEDYCFLMHVTRNSFTSSLYKIENNESKYAENIIKIDENVMEEPEIRGVTIIMVTNKKNIEIKNIKKYNNELHTHELYDLILFQEYGIQPKHEQHKEELKESIKAEKIKKTLVYACYENNTDKILNCLKKTSKTALNKKMEYTGTPLGLCAENNNLKAFKAVLEAGASIDKKSLGETPLEIAYRYSPDIVKYIYEEHGEYFKKEISENGFSIAGSCQDINSLKILLECGVDIDGNDKIPNLHICIDYDNMTGLKFLLENGADINKKNMYKQTVIERAVRKGNEEIVKFLNEYKK